MNWLSMPGARFHDGAMSVVLLAIVAEGVGALVRRWWLLTLPLVMGVGAVLLLAMPGSTIDLDNPLVFLVVLLEMTWPLDRQRRVREPPPIPTRVAGSVPNGRLDSRRSSSVEPRRP